MHQAVLKDYGRAVMHLRSQFATKRFGLILGAGVVTDFNVPMWPEFVRMVAADPDIEGTQLLEGDASKKSLPYQAEMLFQHYRKKARTKLSHPDPSEMFVQSAINAGWSKICGKHIYARSPKKLDVALKKHAYFSSLLPLVRGSHLTITFNFDDFLERALLAHKPEGETGRGYEVVTNPWPQFRRPSSVIYHPHGVVPFEANLMELPTDRLVFAEAAYSAQYVGSRGHDTSYLLSHFARYTCLIIGCSLEDELRNVLMRGAEINPGNYHYYIHYVESEKRGPSAAQRELIAETNFNVYNLITLFLTREKIKALLELLDTQRFSDSDFKDAAATADANLKYNFYLTGCIGVGKSTTANQLRSLHVLDEWQEVRPALLAKSWESLSPKQRKTVDEWIVGQFGKKNSALRDYWRGIAIIDRPPLDPLAFTPEEGRPAKAKALLDRMCPHGRRQNSRVEEGTVILLIGDPDVLAARVTETGRESYSTEKLKKMQDAMQLIYRGAGVHVIDTRNLSVQEVTKRVATIIHRAPYEPCDLHKALEDYANAI